MISIDFDKAQAITKDRLRAERTPLLAAQDVAFQRALEANGDTAAIVAEKQRLRDITSQVDTCTTLDELRSLSCVVPEPAPAPELEPEPAPAPAPAPAPEPTPEGEA
jgi:hypothetical protein